MPGKDICVLADPRAWGTLTELHVQITVKETLKAELQNYTYARRWTTAFLDIKQRLILIYSAKDSRVQIDQHHSQCLQ